MSYTVPAEHIQVVRNYGFINVGAMARSAGKHNVPFRFAATVFGSETGLRREGQLPINGGRNIFGHDPAGVMLMPPGVDLPVCPHTWRLYRHLTLDLGGVGQGLGPGQVTYVGKLLPNGTRDGGLIRIAEEMGYRLWIAEDNIDFSMWYLANHFRRWDSWHTALRLYNGSIVYADDGMIQAKLWANEFAKVR